MYSMEGCRYLNGGWLVIRNRFAEIEYYYERQDTVRSVRLRGTKIVESKEKNISSVIVVIIRILFIVVITGWMR